MALIRNTVGENLIISRDTVGHGHEQRRVINRVQLAHFATMQGGKYSCIAHKSPNPSATYLATRGSDSSFTVVMPTPAIVTNESGFAWGCLVGCRGVGRLYQEAELFADSDSSASERLFG